MKTKKLLTTIIPFLFMSVVSCGENPGNSISQFDYNTEDITMDECQLNVEEIQQATPNAQFVVQSNEHIKGYLIDSMPNKLGSGNFFAWVGTPSTEMPEGGYPAILLIHGGGGNAFADWVDFWIKRGYVALALDINGQMYDEQFSLKRNPNFLANGSWGSVSCGSTQEDFRASWTGVNLTNCMLSYNYLYALENVNKDQIYVTGISWGGYMTCILSGVDKRFNAFVPVYGCGYLHNDIWGLNTAGVSSLHGEALDNWIRLYDPSSYLKYSTKPMLFVAGMDDAAYSSVNRKLSSDLVKGKKFFCYSNSLSHGHYYSITPCIEDFLEKVRNSEKFDKKIVNYEIKDGKFMIEVNENCDNVDFNFTFSDDENSHDWIWEFENTTLTKGKNYFDVDETVTAVSMSFYESGIAVSYSTDLVMNQDIDNYK